MNFVRPAALAMLALAGAANAHPLEDATYEATKLCGVVDQVSIDSCSRSGGRSPEHSAARKAVIRMFDARTAFMRSCMETERYPSDCPYLAEYHMLAGFNRVMKEEESTAGIK